MSRAVKSAIVLPQNCLRAALFHSTPVLERKRRTSWDSRHNSYEKRYRRVRGKKEILRNINTYADYLLQGWQNDLDDDDPSSSGRTSWFRKQYSQGSRRGQAGKQGPQHWRRRHYEFCEDNDVEIENVFRSAFGGSRCFFWSFVDQEDPGWSRSFGNSNYYKRSWNWRDRVEEDDDSSTDSDSSNSDMASNRLALGLSPLGPLKLEDVKNAYRSCALKWHPDRHTGSSKVVAEEKFKLCSAAYQSLCDKLAVD